MFVQNVDVEPRSNARWGGSLVSVSVVCLVLRAVCLELVCPWCRRGEKRRGVCQHISLPSLMGGLCCHGKAGQPGGQASTPLAHSCRSGMLRDVLMSTHDSTHYSQVIFRAGDALSIFAIACSGISMYSVEGWLGMSKTDLGYSGCFVHFLYFYIIFHIIKRGVCLPYTVCIECLEFLFYYSLVASSMKYIVLIHT